MRFSPKKEFKENLKNIQSDTNMLYDFGSEEEVIRISGENREQDAKQSLNLYDVGEDCAQEQILEKEYVNRSTDLTPSSSAHHTVQFRKAHHYFDYHFPNSNLLVL